MGVVFNKKLDGNITDVENNSISDKEAEEFLENCPIDSLIDLKLKTNGIYLKKGLFSSIDGFISYIRRPGQGKLSLRLAFYKILYGLNKEIFSVLIAKLSFTKRFMDYKRKRKENH